MVIAYIKQVQQAKFRRETSPFTVIRRTRIDRDDIIDIAERGK